MNIVYFSVLLVGATLVCQLLFLLDLNPRIPLHIDKSIIDSRLILTTDVLSSCSAELLCHQSNSCSRVSWVI